MQKDYCQPGQQHFQFTEPQPLARYARWKSHDIRLIERCIRVLGKHPMDIRALDVGCGAGEMLRIMVEHLGIGHVMGIDSNAHNISLACKYLRNGREGDCYHLANIRAQALSPWPWMRYHLAIALGSLEHDVDGMTRSLERIRDALYPSGLLFLNVPWQNLRHILLNRLDCAGDDSQFYQWRLTKAELRRELRIAGFTVLEIGSMHKYVGARRLVAALSPIRLNAYLEKAIAIGLSVVLPRCLCAHMIYAIAINRPDHSAHTPPTTDAT